jgi:ubiquitin related modifier 1
MSLSVKVHFSGGLELLFANQRNHQVNLPPLVPKTNATDDVDAGQTPADVNYLIHYLRDHLLKERVELFVENGTV